jgi:hypothetical protein
VVVLNKDERVFARGFFNDRVGKAPIDSDIGVPIGSSKGGTHERDVAHRPQSLICKPVIVPLLLLVAEPDPPQSVLRVAWRHTDAIVCVNGIAVR